MELVKKSRVAIFFTHLPSPCSLDSDKCITVDSGQL
jgi:hypothetical protein